MPVPLAFALLGWVFSLAVQDAWASGLVFPYEEFRL